MAHSTMAILICNAFLLHQCHLKAGTHQADFKELAATKADGVVASRRTEKLRANKLTRAFCACVRGINCLYQQLSIVYIHHSKGETEYTQIYEIYQTSPTVGLVCPGLKITRTTNLLLRASQNWSLVTGSLSRIQSVTSLSSLPIVIKAAIWHRQDNGQSHSQILTSPSYP